MKFKEMTLEKATLEEIQKACLERVQNLNMVSRAGTPYSAALMSELVIVEIKIDALIMLLESHGSDMTEFQKHMREAAKQSRATAINLRSMMGG